MDCKVYERFPVFCTLQGGNNILQLAALYGQLNIVQWIKETELMSMNVTNKVSSGES